MTSAAAAYTMLSVILQIAPSASTSHNYDSIFNPDENWPNPYLHYEHYIQYHHMTYPPPGAWPFWEFAQDMDLTYFTRQEYEAYGQTYWTPDELATFRDRSQQDPFDYVVQKWLDYGDTYTRFLNYTHPVLWVEKFAYKFFFTHLSLAQQDDVFLLARQRMYRNYERPCSIHTAKIDFTKDLDREVMRHILYGYSQTLTDRYIYTKTDIAAIEDERKLFDIIQTASAMHIHRLSERDRKRRCGYNRQQQQQPVASFHPEARASSTC